MKYARFLHDRSELQFGNPHSDFTYQEDLDEKDVVLRLPEVKPDVKIPVIELIMSYRVAELKELQQGNKLKFDCYIVI